MTELIQPVQDLISATMFVIALIFLINFLADQFGGLAESWLRNWRRRDDDV